MDTPPLTLPARTLLLHDSLPLAPPPTFHNSPASAAAAAAAAKDEPPKPVSMRGRKKHKCTVCGNSARSRCPFHACQSCCVKARNPCFIHVFKTNQPPRQLLQQTSPSVGKTDIEQPAGVPSMSSSMGPLSRQFSGQFVPHQAGSTLSPAQQAFDSMRLRTAKSSGHITKKEAMFINAWRFQKLKEYTEGKLAAEDEAFDRYMQNVSLLEEVFALDAEPVEGITPEGHLLIQSGTAHEEADVGFDAAKLSLALRIRLRTNSKRKEAHRQKIRRAIDRSMQKLYRGEREDVSLENEDAYTDFVGVRREMKRIKVQSREGKERLKRMDLFNALFEKLKHVENQTDFNTCLETYEDNFKMESGIFGATNIVSSHSKALVGSHPEENLRVAEGGEKTSVRTLVRSTRKANFDTHGISRGWWKVDIGDIDASREWMATGVDLAAL